MSNSNQSDLEKRLAEEILRTVKAFAAGEIDEEKLTEWVHSWVAHAKQQLG